ncbi:MAG: hypothetical protein ABII79_06435 [bacterium]
MAAPLNYNLRDILTTPAAALSAKRITVMTFFICLALLVFDLFVYLAVLIDGEPLGAFFSVYGLIPLSGLIFSNWVAQAMYALGIAAAVLVLMLGFFGVSAIEIEQIRGNRFFSAGSAIRFSLRRLGQLLLSELAMVCFVGFIVLLIFVFGLVTRIPLLGEWLYALFFLVPNFIIALLTVLVVLVMVLSIVVLPTVAAAERRGESFTAILETFSTIIRQPVRWLVYTAYALVAAKVCSFVYAYFCYRAVQFLTFSASLGAGDKVWRLLKSGASHLPTGSPLVKETLSVFPGIDWSFSLAAWGRGGGNEAAGYLMAVMLFVVFASVIGYALAVVATAQARGYVIIRYHKDGYRIEDEDPLFFEEEHVNPPVEEGDDATPLEPQD